MERKVTVLGFEPENFNYSFKVDPLPVFWVAGKGKGLRIDQEDWTKETDRDGLVKQTE